MLIKPGPLITNMAGTAAGLTIQRSAVGLTGRGKPLPRRRSTSAAMSVRYRVAETVAAWRNLEETQRKDWRTLASTLTFTNRFGDPFTPSGFMVFCRQNFGTYTSPAGSYKYTFAEDPPAVIDCTPPSDVSGTLHLSTGQVVIDSPDGTVASDCRLQLFVSPISSAGKSAHFGRWSWVATAAPDDTFPLDITTGIEAVLGSLELLPESRQIFVRIVPTALDGYPRSAITIRVQGIMP